MRNAKCVVRNGGRGASNLYSAPIPLLYPYNKKTDRVIFHVKHDSIRFCMNFIFIFCGALYFVRRHLHYALRTSHYAFPLLRLQQHHQQEAGYENSDEGGEMVVGVEWVLFLLYRFIGLGVHGLVKFIGDEAFVEVR